jgi:hypothetical protein
MPTEIATATNNSSEVKENLSYESYDKYYSRACEVCVPITLKIPVYVTPVVIEKPPICLEKNGY